MSEDGFCPRCLRSLWSGAMAFLRFERRVVMAWERKVSEAMSGAEWRRLWWFRRTFGIVLWRHGRYSERTHASGVGERHDSS
jgi:hypothetical protein